MRSANINRVKEGEVGRRIELADYLKSVRDNIINKGWGDIEITPDTTVVEILGQTASSLLRTANLRLQQVTGAERIEAVKDDDLDNSPA